MSNHLRIIILVLITSVLVACVTTTESEFGKKADPDAAVSKYVQLASEYLKRDELLRARKSVTRALEIDDEDAPAHATLGLVYHQEGEARRAETHFLKALKIDPEFTRGRTYYAAFLFSENRVAEALNQFDIASSDLDYPQRAQIYTNIALCHSRLEDNSAAIEAYDKSLRIDRFNGRALSGITELLIQGNNFRAAQSYYNRLLGLIRNDGLNHSAGSLWMGVRIADHFGSEQHAQSYAELLESLYPDSLEYSQYQSQFKLR